ncbi:MAG: amidohydrolase family protein [Pseudomonadota bacterium]|nr:amidohydrolase family protein [Pseudomonadota bacterium]
MNFSSYLKRVAIAIGAILAVCVSLFLLGVVWPVRSPAPAQAETPIAIVNVSVVDAQVNQVVAGQTVLVEGGRISAVGDAAMVELPENVRIVNGSSRYLIPALWDMHTHIYAISPLLDLPLHIAYGVTNVRDMQGCPQEGDPFIACAEDKRRWSDEAIAGQRVGPRIMATTSFMANGSVILDRIAGLPAYFATETPEHAAAFVQHYADSADAIKVYDRISRDGYVALVEQARLVGMDVVGHRPLAVSAIEAAANQKSIEHARFILHESYAGSESLRQLAGTPEWAEDRRRMLDEHDPEMANSIFSAMREAGTWYVPTHLTRWADAYADDASVREDPLLRYLHPLMKWQWMEDVNGLLAQDPSPEARQTYREFYEKGLALTGEAHRAGVKTLVGTDYILAGAYVHRELEQLVMAGLTPAQALNAATLASAEYFDLQAEYGTVSAGKVADLILLNANPLEDIANTQQIESVVFNGNLYDSEAIHQISRHVQRQARSWAVACKILWRFILNPVSY